jgi:hypothetical protein
MALSSIVALSAIVAAFLLFAVVLAWVDYQTTNISANKAPSTSHKELHDLREKANEKVMA